MQTFELCNTFFFVRLCTRIAVSNYHQFDDFSSFFDVVPMTFSTETSAVLDYLDHYTGHNLRKRNDIGALLEAASMLDAPDEFNEFIFSGKVAWNLYSTLRKTQSGQEGYQHLESEFTRGVQDMRERLLFFIAQMPEEVTTRFTDLYLGIGQGTMRNLIDLAHDLARFKDLQTQQAR